MTVQRIITALIRHPRLLLSIPRGEAEAARRHTVIESEKVEELFLKVQEKPLIEIVDTFRSKLSYHTAFLYAICRLLRPSVVVETGVHYGASSAFILQALADNEYGRLYSIELPNVTYILHSGCVHADLLTNGQHSGFTVPLHLRSRWELILGDAKVQLPTLLTRVGRIDIFHHDSLRTYEHMMFEFEQAWRYLAEGGLLTSDDVHFNRAFLDFSSNVLRGLSSLALWFPFSEIAFSIGFAPTEVGVQSGLRFGSD